MQFQLNFKSGKPVYLQLVDQVKAAARKYLKPDALVIATLKPEKE